MTSISEQQGQQRIKIRQSNEFGAACCPIISNSLKICLRRCETHVEMFTVRARATCETLCRRASSLVLALEAKQQIHSEGNIALKYRLSGSTAVGLLAFLAFSLVHNNCVSGFLEVREELRPAVEFFAACLLPLSLEDKQSINP